jgi:AhpD family alkylhydroperoxidase
MSWITLPELPSYPWYLRLSFGVLARRGALTEPLRLWGRTPRALLSFLRLFKAVDRDGALLEAGLRSLVMVRVSQVNVCLFCVDLNGSRALDRGVSLAKLEALEDYEGSPLFCERERAALAFADAVTFTGREITPALRERLRAAFPEQAIVELAGLIAFQNMSAKFNFALEARAGGFCRLPAPRARPADAVEAP